jgi:hypothetical protein
MTWCKVSFLDTTGMRHSVEVEAQSMYEAAVLAVRSFKQHDCEPVGMNELEIEVRSSITHNLTITRLHEWLNGGAKSPKEAVMKERLRSLI